MSEPLRWTESGAQGFISQFGDELCGIVGRPVAGEPITSSQLVEVINGGSDPDHMVKQGQATGTPPLPPADLMRASDDWQRTLSWPLAEGVEAAMLAELKAMVSPHFEGLPSAAWESVSGDVRLLRFLRGFQWNVPMSADAVRRFLQVRAEFGLDAGHEGAISAMDATDENAPLIAVTDKSAEISSHIPSARLGVAKGGAPGIGPVTYLNVGKQDKEGFFAAGLERAFIANHALNLCCVMEQLHRLSDERGQMVKLCLIVDLKGASMSQLSHKRWDAEIKGPMERLDRSNAESLGVLFIINAPAYVLAFWRLVKRLIPQRTAAKFHVVGCGDEAKEMRPVIGAACWAQLEQERASADEEDPTTFTVGRGRTHARSLMVKRGASVRWSFATSGDIDFSVQLYLPGGAVPLVEERRMSASEEVVRGEIVVPLVLPNEGDATAAATSAAGCPGELGSPTEEEVLVEVVWSNYFSWFRSKTVSEISVEVLPAGPA